VGEPKTKTILDYLKVTLALFKYVANVNINSTSFAPNGFHSVFSLTHLTRSYLHTGLAFCLDSTVLSASDKPVAVNHVPASSRPKKNASTVEYITTTAIYSTALMFQRCANG
jgi:hypothetical protein